MRQTGPSCALLIFLGLSPLWAQVTFDVVAAPRVSALVEHLLSQFEHTNQSTVMVLSRGVGETSMVRALTEGLADVGFVARVSPMLRNELRGMEFVKIATLTSSIAAAEASSTGLIPSDVYAISPASPTPETRAFIAFLTSPAGKLVLRQHGAEVPMD